MHRSGTSAIAGMLAKLGAEAPRSLMPATKDNPKGYWESETLKRFHDRLLKSAGSRWNDWEAFHQNWGDSGAADEFAEQLPAILQEEYGRARLLLIKDPRICRFLPFWLDVLREMRIEPKVVLPVRNPLEVAGSLEERDGLTPSHSLLVWLRHVLDAEHDSRGLPRSISTYESLLGDWRAEAEKIARELSLRWPRMSTSVQAEIDGYLSKELRHHDAAIVRNRDLDRWVRGAYQALLQLATNESDVDAQRRLDRIRREFDRAGAMFGAAMRQQENKLETVANEAASLRRQLQEQAQRNSDLQTKLSAGDVQTKIHNAAVEAKAQQLAQQVSEQSKTIAYLQGEQVSKAAKLADLAARLSHIEHGRARDKEHYEAKSAKDKEYYEAKIQPLVGHVRELTEQLKAAQHARAKDKEHYEAKVAQLVGNVRELSEQLKGAQYARAKDKEYYEAKILPLVEQARNLADQLKVAQHARATDKEYYEGKLHRLLEQTRTLDGEAKLAEHKRGKDKAYYESKLAAMGAQIADLDRRLAAATSSLDQQRTLAAAKIKDLTQSLRDVDAGLKRAKARQAELESANRKLQRDSDNQAASLKVRFREIAILTRMLLSRDDARSASPQPRSLSLGAIRKALVTK